MKLCDILFSGCEFLRKCDDLINKKRTDKWNKEVQTILNQDISQIHRSCEGIQCENCILNVPTTHFAYFLCKVYARKFLKE